MDIKEILKELIQINTVGDIYNKEIIDYIEEYLKNLGFTTEYKSKCLVMSNRDDCNIGFLGHTDTVSHSSDWSVNPFELTELDGKLYGLGASDMKGSIAAILSAVSKVNFDKFDRGIRLFFTYDEEIGFSGINELVKRETKFPKNMIIGEPTNNEIVNASKGLLEFRVKFKGVSSHSSKPLEGVNAIEKCIEFVRSLQEYYNDLKKDSFDSKCATMNVGVINGGRSINIVPDFCEVLIDFRTVTSEQNKSIIEKIGELTNFEDVDYEVINNILPFANSSDEVNMSDFISEASFIDSKNRYILGAGPINAHKKDEFITIDSLNKLEEQYIEMIEQNCR